MEEWRKVPGLEHYVVSERGRVKHVIRNRIRIPSVNKDGYLRLSLRVNGKQESFTIHRLVMMTFVGPRPDGQEVAHLDGDRKNNNLSNLDYCTRKENAHHQFIHGTVFQGANHPMSKLTVKQAKFILKSKARIKDLAEKFGVQPITVSRIRHRLSWRNLNV